MVAIKTIRASNALIPKSLPSEPIAVFVGATKGIGAHALRAWAKHTSTLHGRTYVVGRPSAAATAILEECRAVCPNGTFNFIHADASLVREIDRACREIKKQETSLNLLFMSQGTLDFATKTSEGLRLIAGLTFYGRFRFMVNLLPLLRSGENLRRVVSTFSGAKEGPMDMENIDLDNVAIKSIAQVRGHGATLQTLAMECISEGVPEVGFVHNFPGWVRTNLGSTMPGLAGVFMRTLGPVIGFFQAIPGDEAGERHLFFATSARFGGKGEGVTMEGLEQAQGTDGRVGGGMYSVDQHGDPGQTQELLAGMRSDGSRKKIWEHTLRQFNIALGSSSTGP